MGQITISAIIVAAGQGIRMNSTVPKQFLQLAGKPILYHTLKAFERSALVQSIVLAVPPSEVKNLNKEWMGSFPIIQQIVAGGAKRQDSVYNSLKVLNRDTHIVVVHDGVRPFFDSRMLEETISAAKDHGAAVTAIPLSDTVKRADASGFVQTTVDRKGLWRIQTPQAFRYSLLCDAMEKAKNDQFYNTDEGALIEYFGRPVKLVLGSEKNLKITKPEDLAWGELLMTLQLNAKR